MNFQNEYIWLIGASSGIGEALAKELASQGATLILSARREEELIKLREALGQQHQVLPLDVADKDEMQQAVDTLKRNIPRIDRAISLAALYRPNDVDQLDLDFAQKLVEANLTGAIYFSYLMLQHMRTQDEGGQIVLCGSVAGYTGLPGGQPYSATKAAIINFAESLHAEAPENIDIKVINPGFVRTRITDKNDFPMPMRIEPPEAAKHIAKGLKRNAFEIHFPKAFTYMVKFLGILPYWLLLPITKRMAGN